MEDGSAASVESILVQSGALGFYQKRLFFCTCFLQALTVSALIYASHCRPDLPSLTPPTATNGALLPPPHCGTKVKVKGNADDNETSEEDQSVLPASHHQHSSGGELRINSFSEATQASVVVDKQDVSSSSSASARASLDTSTASFQDGKSTPARALLDTSTSRFSTVSAQSSTLTVGSTLLNPKHTSPTWTDDGTTKHTSDTVTHSGKVTSRSDPFRDVAVATEVYSQSGSYPSTAPVVTKPQEYSSDATGRPHLQWTDTETASPAPSSSQRPQKHRRDSASKTTSTKVLRDSDAVSSPSDVKVKSLTLDDVTASVALCEQSHEEDDSGPVYLALTTLPAPEWLGDVDKEQLAQYNAYCQAVGAMVGAALGAMGADQVGRRRPLYVYFPFMLLAHCLSGFAVSWTMLAVFRFLVGAFAGACAVVSLVFPLEFIGTEWRDACVCSGIWVVGVGVISLELLVTRHWRYLAFISGGIGLPLIGTYFIASESARWLLCHQKFPEAESTLKEVISCNSTSVPDFLSLFDKSRACVVTNMHHKRYTYLDLFHSWK